MVGTIRESREDRIFQAVIVSVLSVVVLVTVYPLYFVVIASVTDPDVVNAGNVLLYPVRPTLEGYGYIMDYTQLWIGYGNTVFYAVAGALVSTMATFFIAYPLSRKDFSLRKPLTFYILFTMFFYGGLIPTYLVVRSLGLLNTRAIIIILNSVVVWNTMIARTFLQTTVPSELYEAAVMDGCDHFTYMFRILIPTSKAIIVVLLLFYGVAQWNGFFKALIYLKDESLFPLQLVLRQILASTQVTQEMVDALGIDDVNERARTAELVKYGVIIISTLPLLIVYPFLQRFFVKGVMIGSVKG